MQRLVWSGRVHIRELIHLVGAIGPEPKAVEEAVRHLYDWHNSRGIAGMQLTFAPAATAILAIVAKPDSTLVIVIAGAVVLVTLVLGVFQLLALNWLHGEYVYALRLAMEFGTFHAELALYPHGAGSPAVSAVRKLYDEIGSVSMVTYRADLKARERVLNSVSACRAQTA